jgi:cysteine synthase
MVAARRLLAELPDLQTVVTVLCDEGEKYITDHHLDRPGT